MTVVIGWDVGGAHLKAARIDDGRVTDAVQVASPLRLGLERLSRSFSEAKDRIGAGDRHVVTMTGELADTFASRQEGVRLLSELAARELAPAPISLYAGRAGFIAPDVVQGHIEDIASANWHASAALVARIKGAALFADMGSTTTDLVPLCGGSIAARGYTDAERLAAGELVYTGLVRSFLMAVASRAPFAGRWTPLINENFATMADVYRILGQLPDGADQMTTADGRPRTVEASCARLARMVGSDAAAAEISAWTALARWFAEQQLQTLVDAALFVLSGSGLPFDAPVVGAGIGETVLHELARRLGRSYLAIGDLLPADPGARVAASCCTPAAAVALLASPARLASCAGTPPHIQSSADRAPSSDLLPGRGGNLADVAEPAAADMVP